MKKTLVALAALASMSAFAQSSVTMYGNLDYSFTPSSQKTVTSGTNAAGADVADVTTKAYGVRAVGANTNFSSNALGFKGTEDLGNGLKANFQIEVALNGNQGTGNGNDAPHGGLGLFANSAANPNNARDTWVGLSGGFGEVRVGYQSTHEFASGGVEQAGSANLISNLNGTTGFGRQARHDMVNYISPSFNGFTATVQWGKGKASTDTERVVQGVESSRTHQNIGLNYVQGPLVVAAGTRTGKSTNNGTTVVANGATPAVTIAQSGLLWTVGPAGNAAQTFNAQAKTKANYIHANYDLGVAKLFAGYITHKNSFGGDFNGAVIDGSLNKSKSTTIGAQIPMGNLVPFVSIARGKQEQWNGRTGVQDAGFGSDKLKANALGAVYSFSKRTSAYAVYNTVKVDTSFEAAPLQTEKSKITQTLVGLRHQF